MIDPALIEGKTLGEYYFIHLEFLSKISE